MSVAGPPPGQTSFTAFVRTQPPGNVLREHLAHVLAHLPVQGDYPVYENTCYAIELNGSHVVPEWDTSRATLGLGDGGAFTKGGGTVDAHHLVGQGPASPEGSGQRDP